MKEITIQLEHCYGIKEMDEVFAFKEAPDGCRNRFIGIYSPNGSMKTSLAKTFRCVQGGEDVPTDAYGNEPKKKISVDQRDIDAEGVLVIESFDDKLESLDVGESSALLLNDDLKKEYDALLAEEKGGRAGMLSDIKERSGGLSEDEFCAEVEAVFGSPFEEVIKEHVVNNDLDEDQSVLLGVKYKKFFNDSLTQVCNSDEVKEKFEAYRQKVSDIGFFSDNFTPISFFVVKGSLEKNEFFSNNRNKVVIYDDQGDEMEFRTVDEMWRFIATQIGPETEQIISILNKNKGTRDIAKHLDTNPGLVSRLGEIEIFKKDVLLSYLFEKQEECSAFLDIVEKNKKGVSRIKERAIEEETVWEGVLQTFKKRFSVPFNITIKDKSHAVLVDDERMKYFSFEIERGDEKATVEDHRGLGFLSAGEKKALYILRMLFNIEMRKRKMKRGEELLIILDDVADSFDYKNKYAILQYLKDFKDQEESIYFIILTHNFDFFRNLVRKDILKGDFENKLIATSNEGVVSIEKFESHIVQNAFGKLSRGGNIGPIKTVACIPFLRTLLEMRGETKGNADYDSLTSMLHVNKDSDGQTVSKIGDAYKRILNKDKDQELMIDTLSEDKKVREYIADVAEKEIIESQIEVKENDLYKKVCLAVAVRLLAEEFCIRKLGKKVVDITDSTEIFSEFLKSSDVKPDEKEIIESVDMGTPDYIHTNSFMYEPLIDQSADGLLSLYHGLKEMVNGMDAE